MKIYNRFWASDVLDSYYKTYPRAKILNGKFIEQARAMGYFADDLVLKDRLITCIQRASHGSRHYRAWLLYKAMMAHMSTGGDAAEYEHLMAFLFTYKPKAAEIPAELAF